MKINKKAKYILAGFGWCEIHNLPQTEIVIDDFIIPGKKEFCKKCFKEFNENKNKIRAKI